MADTHELHRDLDVPDADILVYTMFSRSARAIEDFDAWLGDRERWFRERNLPFRRGFLLHGDPGNGSPRPFVQ